MWVLMVLINGPNGPNTPSTCMCNLPSMLRKGTEVVHKSNISSSFPGLMSGGDNVWWLYTSFKIILIVACTGTFAKHFFFF